MRNGDFVWLCKRVYDEDNDIETFEAPIRFQLGFHNLTVQPASGYSEVVEFGENIGRTWNCIGQPYEKWINLVHEGDRFYVDGAKPCTNNGAEPEDGWGFDANARVYSVRPQNLAVRFILQKIK